MDEYLFKEWFINEFVSKVKTHLTKLKLPTEATLLLENAPTHPANLQCEGESGIKLLHLPPNVTSLQQPMDQGVIKWSKTKYCQKLLSDILEKLDADKSLDLIKRLKIINMKYVIYMVAEAYDEILPTTLLSLGENCSQRLKKLLKKMMY